MHCTHRDRVVEELVAGWAGGARHQAAPTSGRGGGAPIRILADIVAGRPSWRSWGGHRQGLVSWSTHGPRVGGGDGNRTPDRFHVKLGILVGFVLDCFWILFWICLDFLEFLMGNSKFGKN
jgi:hypothetical protein